MRCKTRSILCGFAGFHCGCQFVWLSHAREVQVNELVCAASRAPDLLITAFRSCYQSHSIKRTCSVLWKCFPGPGARWRRRRRRRRRSAWPRRCALMWTAPWSGRRASTSSPSSAALEMLSLKCECLLHTRGKKRQTFQEWSRTHSDPSLAQKWWKKTNLKLFVACLGSLLSEVLRVDYIKL